MADSLYGPMVDVLREAFGVEFELWDTGGGCTALVGEFEADTTVYLTDAPSSRLGSECQISDRPLRRVLGEDNVGFAVGVYRDEHRTNVTYREYPHATTPMLPRIVAEQLAAAVKARCPDLDTPQERNEL